MRTIILASASPRRAEILRLTGLRFKVRPGNYEEDLSLKSNRRELARFLSRKKAESVAPAFRDAIIIAADTFIVFRKCVLGKPRTEKEAEVMLGTLNGRAHSVITGFTIIDTGSGQKVSRSVKTKVYFRKLVSTEIRGYVRSGEPMGKAGAYAVQGLGAVFIENIEGDFFNVMGLPLCALTESLKKFGVHVLRIQG